VRGQFYSFAAKSFWKIPRITHISSLSHPKTLKLFHFRKHSREIFHGVERERDIDRPFLQPTYRDGLSIVRHYAELAHVLSLAPGHDLIQIFDVEMSLPFLA
jgi:hypothetical protein